MQSPNEKPIKISDIVFTAVIIAVGILIWFFASTRTGGSTVVFRQDGELLAELPLDTDAVYTVEGTYINEFTIEDGSVRVTYTTCPNHQCERTGAVSATGAGIVCAPNHVSAVITGEGGEVDAVTG